MYTRRQDMEGSNIDWHVVWIDENWQNGGSRFSQGLTQRAPVIGLKWSRDPFGGNHRHLDTCVSG